MNKFITQLWKQPRGEKHASSSNTVEHTCNTENEHNK